MKLSSEQVASLAGEIISELEKAVVGKRAVLESVLTALLADGHLLLEDLPGLAKTLIARSVARVTSLCFSRIQFTPDLMPADVTGTSIYNQKSGEFEFRPGPVFANLLLGDEINRAPAKTQSALLEAMQERQVTVDGIAYPLPKPFLVMATQNPIEYEGTYPLPEAQLDRFIARLSIGYPDRGSESVMLERRGERKREEVDLRPVVDAETFVAMQQAVEEVHVSESVRLYMVDLVRQTREDRRLLVGASPRGSLALFGLARARAILEGRDFVIPDDVKAVAVPALAHRLTLRPEYWAKQVSGEDIVRDVLSTVATPTVFGADQERP